MVVTVAFVTAFPNFKACKNWVGLPRLPVVTWKTSPRPNLVISELANKLPTATFDPTLAVKVIVPVFEPGGISRTPTYELPEEFPEVIVPERETLAMYCCAESHCPTLKVFPRAPGYLAIYWTFASGNS